MSEKRKILIDGAKIEVLKQLQTLFGKMEIFWALSGSNAFNVWTNTEEETDDIDIRIDKIWVREKTPEFIEMMNENGFYLINLREMTFEKEVIILNKKYVVDIGLECSSFGKNSVEILEVEGVNLPVLSVKSLIEIYELGAKSTLHSQEKVEKYKEKLRKLKTLEK